MNTDSKTMKAISLWEPWATAMALGLKANETRSWFAAYRGDLVICSAKRPTTALEHAVCAENRIDPATLVFGCALCIVELYDCVSTNGLAGKIPAQEARLGNYEFGRFAWLTRNLRRFETPIPVSGKQGFFNVEIPIRVHPCPSVVKIIPPTAIPNPQSP